MTPLIPRRHPRYDAQGRLVGTMAAFSHLEADAERAAEPGAMGKDARFEDGPRVGRISDVIFELTTGEILAYEFTDDAGSPHYLPAVALARETPSALCFPPQARDLIRPDLSGLGQTLQGSPKADEAEFTILEDFPPLA